MSLSRQRLDITGVRFGKLVAVKRLTASRGGHFRWLCLCDCGNEREVLATHLVQGNTKSCGCSQRYTGQHHKQFNGCGELTGDHWSTIVRAANGSKGRRVLEMSIDKEYAWELYLLQDKKCALSGLPLVFGNNLTLRTASLDRIDSSIGYVEGNVQWVHKDINMMKRNYDQTHFIEMCVLVANNNINTVGGSIGIPINPI